MKLLTKEQLLERAKRYAADLVWWEAMRGMESRMYPTIESPDPEFDRLENETHRLRDEWLKLKIEQSLYCKKKFEGK